MTGGGARQFDFASEPEIEAMLRNDELPYAGSLLCLRRNLPGWWPDVRVARPALALAHVPIPPSLDPGCADRLTSLCTRAVLDMASPILVFCKEGRHRSGMVEAITCVQQGATLDTAVERYLKRTKGGGRDREIALIRRAARQLV